MRSSLQRRFAVATGVFFAAGFVASGYILNKFHVYEDSATRVMSGDQKYVVLGHLLEARVKGAEELGQNSVGSQEANEAFREKISAIAEDLKNLDRDRPDKNLDETKKTLSEYVGAKPEQVEDLFVHYRNLKTSVFNVYRMAWNNKWMTVAKSMGLIINDLDNLPYQSGEKAAVSIFPKITQLVAYITRAPIAQASKMLLFSQLNGLKSQVVSYTDAIQRAEKVRAKRVEDLRAAGAFLRKFNETQGKSMVQFSDIARTDVFKALLAFSLFILFGMGWFVATTKRFAFHLAEVAAHVTKQMTGWITSGGSINNQGFKSPDKADAEFTGMYQTLDQTMRKMNLMRKEDLLVKRLLNVPFLLINQEKQAIFWNSALSILGKVRALEEVGPVAYANLLRFTDVKSRAVDPVGRAFTENKEVSQLVLFRVGDDGIAAQVVCTPVSGPDHQSEYVMVHIRDLREENRKHEVELDRQLQVVLSAIEDMSRGQVPQEAPEGSRRPIRECLRAIRAFAMDEQEKDAVMAGNVGTMQERMVREAGLKKTIHGRMEQVFDEVNGMRHLLQELRGHSEAISARLAKIEVRGKATYDECTEMRKRGQGLSIDLKSSQSLVANCLSRLAAVEEMSGRVRANERMIHAILEKSTLLSTNNSVLGSKRDLTANDVVAITENVSQLLGQFERGYRFIEQSVDEVEKGVGELVTTLRENLAASGRLTSGNQALINMVLSSEKLVQGDFREVTSLTREIQVLKNVTGRLAARIHGVEAKIQHLVQIGRASLDLQAQLEIGFKGMFNQLQTPEADSNANPINESSA